MDNKKINPLVVYYTAVDLPEVIEGLKTIPYDQFHISYFRYPYPHRIAEGFFHAHKEYTHMVLITGDLVVNQGFFNSLLWDIEKNDFDVLCGVCNVDLDRHKDHLNICEKLPKIGPYEQRTYRWMADSTRKYCIENGLDIIKVKFAGFPQMWIKRHVLEKTRINWLTPELRGKNPALWEASGGWANDLAFAHNLNSLGIDIWCDLKVKMKHLRYQGIKQIGKKPPKVNFIRYEPNLRYVSEIKV